MTLIFYYYLVLLFVYIVSMLSKCSADISYVTVTDELNKFHGFTTPFFPTIQFKFQLTAISSGRSVL